MTGSADKTPTRAWENWDHGDVAEHIDAFWTIPTEVAMRHQLMSCLAQFQPLGSVYEIGCGSGRIYGSLREARLVGPRDYRGGDVSRKMLSLARKHYRSGRFETRDIYNLPADLADTVLCIQVLQHLPDYRDALAQLVAASRCTLFVASWFGITQEIHLTESPGLTDGKPFYQNVYELESFSAMVQNLRQCTATVMPLGGLLYALAFQFEGKTQS